MAAPRLPISAYRHLLRHNFADGLLNVQRRYGDVIKLPLRSMYFVSDPQIIQYVTQTGWRNFRKSAALKRAKPLLGEGLLTSEGALWTGQRRLMAPAFHRSHIAALADAMIDEIGRMLQRWALLADGAVLDISAEFDALTMQIATRCLFSTQTDAATAQQVTKSLHFLLNLFRRRTLFPVPGVDALPLRSNKRAASAIEALDQIVYGMIDQRRKQSATYGDLLGMLMAAQDEETGRQMSDKQLRDEVMTLFLAGFETTASHLAWTMLLLSDHKDVRGRLRNVVCDVPISAESARSVPYLNAIMDESLRLYPPGWLFGREALADAQVGPLELKAGETVLMSSYVVHRHAKLWPNPDDFAPQRWLQHDSPQHKLAFWPFGAGPRLCIGSQFARMEAALTLLMIAQRYEVSILPEQRRDIRASMTLRPKFNLKARIKPL